MLALENIEVRKELKPFIRKITLFRSEGDIEYRQRLMPSGYSCFSYNQSILPSFKIGRNQIDVPGRLHVIGPKVNNNISVFHKGIINQVLVEFSAIGFYSLFNYSPFKLKNLLSAFNSVKPKDEFEEFENKLAQKNDINESAEVIQDFFIAFSEQAICIDKRIAKVIVEIESKKGIISVKEAFLLAGIGERHFNRLFKDIVGCSPKVFIKILQLHAIISKMEEDGRMLDLAYDSGFYDQAHFNKSFKKMVGMSPNKFIRSSEHVSFKYFKE